MKGTHISKSSKRRALVAKSWVISYSGGYYFRDGFKSYQEALDCFNNAPAGDGWVKLINLTTGEVREKYYAEN